MLKIEPFNPFNDLLSCNAFYKFGLNDREQRRQRVFVEKLCEYSAFEVCWGPDFRNDNFNFQDLLNEVV